MLYNHFKNMVLSVMSKGADRYFVDLEQCREFFNRYAEKANLPLQVFISMDNFHDNYDREKGRAIILDNVVKVLEEMPVEKRELFKIHVVIIVTKDPDSTLPKEMKEHYGTAGITFGDFPMMPIGKAKDLADLLPEQPEFKPPPGRDGEEQRNYGAVLMGDAYYHFNKKVGDLGHLAEMHK